MSNQNALYELLVHANYLKRLPRTGWLFAGIPQPESIAEHSYVTTLLVLQLGTTINQQWQDEELNGPLDINKAIQTALIHDLAESLLTDIPKRSAELIGKEVKHQAEITAIQRITEDLPEQERLVALLHDYTQRLTPEARLVKDADLLEMVFQAHVYEQHGYTNLAEFWEGHHWCFRASEALFHEINAHQ